MSREDDGDRLATLEARYARLRAVVVAIALGGLVFAAAAWAGGERGGSSERTVEARRVILVDSAGRRAADLTADSAGIQIRLFAPHATTTRMRTGERTEGELVVARALLSSRSGLLLADGAGNAVARLGDVGAGLLR